MSDNSNPNHRPINVVTFLAAHPTETFTLAEIARHLGLSKGSAHRVMTALTETGFVSRHPRHKTYGLGIALVAIGQAALERYPGIERARREMARLANELQVGLGATAIVGDEYLLLGRAGNPRTYDGLTLIGERRVVVPSIGIGQMAWRKESEIEAYLAKGASYLDQDMLRHLRGTFPAIRRRGFSMAANGLGILRLINATIIPSGSGADTEFEGVALNADGQVSASEFQLLNFEEAAEKGINYVAAPVFSPEGDVCLEIVMSAFPDNLGIREIERYASKLVEAADTVTNEIRGRKPKPW